MLDIEDVRRIIREGVPALDLASLRFFAEGWDYEMWEMDGDLLFRLPKRDECIAPLAVEARLLSELAQSLSVAVPRPEHVTAGFFSYRKLSGVPLSDVRLLDQARLAIARALGRFLSELHRFPVERARTLGVRVYDPATRYTRMRDEVLGQTERVLTERDKRAIGAFWQDFLTNDAYARFAPRLTHGDLDDAHVLVETGRGEIAGVIDFGDARIGDPALDFAGFEGTFREALLSSYDLRADETLRERADIYRRKISPLHGLLHGIKIGDDAWIERGLAALREGLGCS